MTILFCDRCVQSMMMCVVGRGKEESSGGLSVRKGVCIQT